MHTRNGGGTFRFRTSVELVKVKVVNSFDVTAWTPRSEWSCESIDELITLIDCSVRTTDTRKRDVNCQMKMGVGMTRKRAGWGAETSDQRRSTLRGETSAHDWEGGILQLQPEGKMTSGKPSRQTDLPFGRKPKLRSTQTY